MTKAVDLETLTKGEVHNLSGHDRGLAARALFGLDELDVDGEMIEIRVPDHVYAVSPSFVQGLLAKSVHTLGDARDRFSQHYTVVASDLVRRQFDRGLSAILTDRSQPVI